MNELYKDFLKLNFYQIYPKSFCDLNNDGIGDFKGIISKIPYLKELGIKGVWISPFFKSPNVDSGYDIEDYLEIDPIFGTLDDFKELLDKFHKVDIKVIIDLVVNHTSTSHKWFKEAISSKNNKYQDYYYFVDSPLNNWQSVFGGSVWEYVEELDKYYLHSFDKKQADLNWNNPLVREEVKNIIDYWVNIGVDGFRCDVIDRISKDFKLNKQTCGPNLHKYLNEIFDRPNCKNLYIIGECWSTDESTLFDLTHQSRGELTSSFLSGNVRHHKGRFNIFDKIDFKEIHDYFSKYETLCENNDLIFSPFFENHDQARSISRLLINDNKKYRYELSTFIGTLLYTIKGTPFILQGEEFGTPDPYYNDIKYFDDVETINYYNKEKEIIEFNKLISIINRDSRDSGRRPMMWNNSINGGFNKGANPWISLHSNIEEYNLEKDLNSNKSFFKYYQSILKLRNKSDTLIYGKFIDLTNKRKDIFVYKRVLNNEEYLIVLNYDKESFYEVSSNYELIMSNYLDNSKILRPFESRIYKMR